MSSQDGQQAGAIEVNTSFIWLSFMLFFVKTRVVVDGMLYELPWGTNTFPAQPGRHHVRVSFKYLFYGDVCGNELFVDVPPGHVVQVRCRAPWLIPLKGKMTITGARPASEAGAAMGPAYRPSAYVVPVGAPPASAAPQAGWFADPAARHELRYWDGQAWTPHVSDRGTTTTDPL